MELVEVREEDAEDRVDLSEYFNVAAIERMNWKEKCETIGSTSFNHFFPQELKNV